MSGKPKICLSGFVLSALMFDNSNSQGDQEGFLIGTVTKNVKSEINDQSMCNTQEEVVISIYSSVPCGDFLSFYNACGNIRESDIDSHLGERRRSVVGWYRFRRHCPVYPSMREAAVHRNLRSLFSRYNEHNDEYFVYAVLTASSLHTFATHSYDYAFYAQNRNNSFKALAFSLLNLGDTKNQYRSTSVAAAYMESTSFTNVLSTPWSFSSCWETEDILQQFHNRLRVQLDNLQEELAASDTVNASLDHEVAELDNEMQNLLSARESSSPDPTCETEGATDSSVKADELGSSEDSKPSSSKSPDNKVVCSKRVADAPQRPDSAKRLCFTKYFEHDQDPCIDVSNESLKNDQPGKSELSQDSASAKQRVKVIYRHVPLRVAEKAIPTPIVYHGRAAEIKKSAGATKEVPVSAIESSPPAVSDKVETDDGKLRSCSDDITQNSGDKENELKYLFNQECSSWEKQASIPYEPGILTPPKEEEMSDNLQASQGIVLEEVNLNKQVLIPISREQSDQVIQADTKGNSDNTENVTVKSITPVKTVQRLAPPYIVYASKDVPPVISDQEVSKVHDPLCVDKGSKDPCQSELELQSTSKDKVKESNVHEEPTVKDPSDIVEH